jgi:hypothetical protein
MNGMSNTMSHPNIAPPGKAFNTVWWVEQMPHAASDKKMSMSLALIVGPQEKMPCFQITPGPILSSQIHSNSSQYDPLNVWLKK